MRSRSSATRRTPVERPERRPALNSLPSRQRKVEALGSPVSRSCEASKSLSAARRSRSSVHRVTSTPTEVTEVGRPSSPRLGVADQATIRTRPSLVRSGASTQAVSSLPVTARSKARTTRRRCSGAISTSCQRRPLRSLQRHPPRASRSPLAKARRPSASVIMARTICRPAALSSRPPTCGRHPAPSASIRRRPLESWRPPPGIPPGQRRLWSPEGMEGKDAFSQPGTLKRQQRHRHTTPPSRCDGRWLRKSLTRTEEKLRRQQEQPEAGETGGEGLPSI